MNHNIELKARLYDMAAAREIAASLARENLGVQRQVDTYFHCREGRLKLRQIEGQPAQLIWYRRPDGVSAKQSDYLITPVEAAQSLRTALAGALGIRVEVTKRREIFLHHNVRIHLDLVADLGVFLEFEVVLANAIDATAGHAQVAELQQRFNIRPEDLLACSYADLLLEQKM